MQLDISHDIRKLTKKLDYVQKAQIPFATSLALNDVGYHIAASDKNPKGFRRTADRRFEGGAEKYTKRGFRYTKSTKKNLKVVVGIHPSREDYMTLQVEGGMRKPKRKYVPVYKEVDRNEHGNIKRATINQIRKGKNIFKGVPKNQNLPRGIYERHQKNTRIKPLAYLKNTTRYKSKFPLYAIVKNNVRSRRIGFADNFKRRLKDALRTAN